MTDDSSPKARLWADCSATRVFWRVDIFFTNYILTGKALLEGNKYVHLTPCKVIDILQGIYIGWV